jgi:hypothetical protein
MSVDTPAQLDKALQSARQMRAAAWQRGDLVDADRLSATIDRLLDRRFACLSR